jgi:hypothetical protein
MDGGWIERRVGLGSGDLRGQGFVAGSKVRAGSCGGRCAVGGRRGGAESAAKARVTIAAGR